MDIPLPDDPPPIKVSQISNDTQNSFDSICLPSDIQLPTEHIPSPPTLAQSIPTEKHKFEPNQPFSDAEDSRPYFGEQIDSRTSLEIELPPVSTPDKLVRHDVYSPSLSEHSQSDTQLPSPVNSTSDEDNSLGQPLDQSSSQPLDIDLPPSNSNDQESDSQSCKFTHQNPSSSPSGVILPPGVDGNSSSKFPWDIDPPPGLVPLPSEISLPKEGKTSPWEIDLPSDNDPSAKTAMQTKFDFEPRTMMIPLDMDIPMPDDEINDPNRYSPSLPIDDDPPLEITPPQPNSSSKISLQAPPLPPFLPSSLSGASTVLGKTKAKKRLMAFSMAKQGGTSALSFQLSKKVPPVSKETVKVFDDKDEGKKKSMKKSQSVDKARDTISEIEELKRREMLLRENMQLLNPRWASRDSHLYPTPALPLPATDLLDSKKTIELESIVGELLAKKERRKEEKRHESEERDRRRSSKSKRDRDRDRDKEKRKRKPKTLPLDWKEFKKEGHKVHHFRRFKFEVTKNEEKEKRRHSRSSRDRRSRSKDRDKKSSKSSTSQTGRINLLDTPMEIRNVLLVHTPKGDILEFRESQIKYTKCKPQLSFSENPRFQVYHYLSREEMLNSVPHDIEEIIYKFLNSIRPKRLKVKTESNHDDKTTVEGIEKVIEEENVELSSAVDNVRKYEIENEQENNSNKEETGEETAKIEEEEEHAIDEESKDEKIKDENSKDEKSKDEKSQDLMKKESKPPCKKLHRNWLLPWKNNDLTPQLFKPDVEEEIEEENINPMITVSVSNDMKKGKDENSGVMFSDRTRNTGKSSDNTVITEQLEPIIRTAIRSKWDSDYEDSEEERETKTKMEDVLNEKISSPVTNGGVVDNEPEDVNLGEVPMELVEEEKYVEDTDKSPNEEPEKTKPNVVEKLASEYEEFMKMVSFENKEEEDDEADERSNTNYKEDDEDKEIALEQISHTVQSESNSEFEDKLNKSLDGEKKESFIEFLDKIEKISNKKPEPDSEEESQNNKDMWEMKKLYFNKSRSLSQEESDWSGEENEIDKRRNIVEKIKLKQHIKKKKVQASKIKKKLKDKKTKKKKKKYSSSESSSSSSSDGTSDDSSSSGSSSSSDSSSESSSSSSSSSSIDRKKNRKKKKIEKLKDKLKNKKNKKNAHSSSSEDESNDKRNKGKRKKKKKIEKKKLLKESKAKDKKNKKKRRKDSTEEDEPPTKKVKSNKKNKDSISESKKRTEKSDKLVEKKLKEIRLLEKLPEINTLKQLKRISQDVEDNNIPLKKMLTGKDMADDDLSNLYEMRKFVVEKQKFDEDNTVEVEIDEDFKKSKEYIRMKKRELEMGNAKELDRVFLGETKSYKLEEECSDDTKDKLNEAQIKEHFLGSSNENHVKLKKHETDEVEHELNIKESKSNQKLKKGKKEMDKEESLKNKKKSKKDKKKKESDGSKSKKKKRKKSKHSSRDSSDDEAKDEKNLVDNHIPFLRDENFLYELAKDKGNIGDKIKKQEDFNESFHHKMSSSSDSYNQNKSKVDAQSDKTLKKIEDDANDLSQLRNLDWHDDTETRVSTGRSLQAIDDNPSISNDTSKEDAMYRSVGKTLLNDKKCEFDFNSASILSPPLDQFQQFTSTNTVGESDDEKNILPSPESSLNDINLNSSDDSFVLEKDEPINENKFTNVGKKGVFSEVCDKDNEGSPPMPDKFNLQKESFKNTTNDSDRYSPTLDLDILSPAPDDENKQESDMSLDSNEPEDYLNSVKKSTDLNMLDIPLPPSTTSTLPSQPPPPAPVPPPVLQPQSHSTSPSFKNILNPPIPALLAPPSLPAPVSLVALQPITERKQPIKLPLTNTKLTLNKPLVKIKPANIFEDDDDESNSIHKTLPNSPDKVQPEESDDPGKKKQSRWGMEPEDELPIVKLYLANEVGLVKTIDDTNCESQISRDLSNDTSNLEKLIVHENKSDDSNRVESQAVNEKRDMSVIDVSNIDVENAQEAWKDQENFTSVKHTDKVELPKKMNDETGMYDKTEHNTDNMHVNKIETPAENIHDENIDNSNIELTSKQYSKLHEEPIVEEILKTDRNKYKNDDHYRRKDYSDDRSRSSRRRDSSRDRRWKRDSSRDRRDYRKDRSRSRERRRDRYRRDSPDRKEKRNRSRDRDRRSRRDSPRDRKRERSPRRKDSPRRREDIKISPHKKDEIRESPRKKEDFKEKKLPINSEKQEFSQSESSSEETETNMEEVIANIKEEPVDDGYVIAKENTSNQLAAAKLEVREPESSETPVEPPPLVMPEFRTQKIKINFKNPIPVKRKTSPLGFKKSLADSTISDSDLIPVKKLVRTNVCLSPKRLSLDDRIELELGVKKSPPPTPVLQTYQIPVHDGSQISIPILPTTSLRRAPTTLVQPPRVDWEPTCPPPSVPSVKSQVLQVGNILQVVPTEMPVPPAPPVPAPMPVAPPVPISPQQENLQQITNKVLQIGNMIQVVPTTTIPNLTAQIFANAIASAVASASKSSPKHEPSPVVKPVAPVQPTPVPVVPTLKDEVQVSPVLLPLPVAKKTIPVPTEGELKRIEKERKKKEKEIRRQKKQKKATKKMIREALLMKEALESSDMENDDVRLSEEDGTEEEEQVLGQNILSTPIRNKITSPLPPAPGKGILVSPGFREKPVFPNKPTETRKVSFADGVHPGEGTSPSASEEHPHSPPPQPSTPKEKRFKKKKKKHKVKVRIIRVEEGDDDEDEEDDGSPPPPPPGSPPPMFHYPPPPPGFMYAPPPSFTVLQGSAPVYQQHHSSTTTTHTTTVQFAPPPPTSSKHARK